MRPNIIDAADIPDSLVGFVKVTSQREGDAIRAGRNNNSNKSLAKRERERLNKPSVVLLRLNVRAG